MGAVDLASTIAVLSLYSYSRDQEREADHGGFSLLVNQGYDAQQSAEIWKNVYQEMEANPGRDGPAVFLRTHPTEEERIATLSDLAAELEAEHGVGDLGTDRYRAAILPHRAGWLEGELNRAEYEESIALIQRLIELDPNSGELRFFLGEAYRRRNAEGDLPLAAAAYQNALHAADVPLNAHRGLGMVALKTGDRALARSSFETYLASATDEGDRAMVQLYLNQIGNTP